MSDKLCRKGFQPRGMSINKSPPHLCRHQPSEVQMLLLPLPHWPEPHFFFPLQIWQVKLPREMTWSQSPGHMAGAPVTAQVSGAGLGWGLWIGRAGSLGIIWGLKGSDEEVEKLGNYFWKEMSVTREKQGWRASSSAMRKCTGSESNWPSSRFLFLVFGG